jgi:hypothetical protein
MRQSNEETAGRTSTANVGGAVRTTSAVIVDP